MAESFLPRFSRIAIGVAGSTPATFLTDPVPARTCGPLGYQDAGDPSVLSFLGDTPGPLGVSDYGTPEIIQFPALKAINPVPKSAGQGQTKSEENPDVISKGKKKHIDDMIGDADYDAAAKKLGCEAEVLKAIGYQESGKLRTLGLGAFDKQNRPTILYERHIFSQKTTPPHRYDAKHPDISAPNGYVAGTLRDAEKHSPVHDNDHYGLFSWQYAKLAKAYALDRDAALQACSWGKFQIMGFNFGRCGYQTVRDFVLDMCISEKKHLSALVGFCGGVPLKSALQKKDWVAIATAYNGANYKVNKYDVYLKTYYDSFKAKKLKPK